MAVLRGKGHGIELDFTDRAFDEALAELEGALARNPGFYTGSAATAAFGDSPPTAEQLTALRASLSVFGVGLEALTGPAGLQQVALDAGLDFHPREPSGPAETFVRRRANRPRREAALSEAARSLAADFAGARADLAARRSTGVPIRQFTPPVARRSSAALTPVPAAPSIPATHYHLGTVRGGQSLHHVGNLVIVGDVNPGAELVASGDILVFGALRGVAHAGAQGDASARVYSLILEPTQLRVAALIAADDRPQRAGASLPEVALIRDGRIAIVPYTDITQPPEEKSR